MKMNSYLNRELRETITNHYLLKASILNKEQMIKISSVRFPSVPRSILIKKTSIIILKSPTQVKRKNSFAITQDVGKNIPKRVIWLFIKDNTLAKSPMNVKSVQKHSLQLGIEMITKRDIQRKSKSNKIFFYKFHHRDY